jgi:hypothetical protein
LFELAKILNIYWAIECIVKVSIKQLFELARIIYVYWLIECIPKFWFEGLFELGRINNIYWEIECILKPWFEKKFQHARIIDIYWRIECTNLDLKYCLRLHELPMSIKQLNVLQNLNVVQTFVKAFKLAKITHAYWWIRCIPNLHLSKCLN